VSRLGGHGLSDGRKDLFDRGLENQPLLGHYLPIHQDGEFTTVAVHQFDLEPRLFPQGVRHPGGMLSGAASDGTLPDRHLLHRCISFFIGRRNITTPETYAEGVPSS
jgi:hypothetical protein